MKVRHLNTSAALREFRAFPEEVYRGNANYRGTDASIEKLLTAGKSAFYRHATSELFLLSDGRQTLARFALIHDQRLPENVQVSFFEALPEAKDVFEHIRETIKHFYPQCSKAVVGLNGHLNYGAGILLNRFDEAPLFGLPYNPPYYPNFFSQLSMKPMHTYRFRMNDFHSWAETYRPEREIKGLSIRFMNKKNIKHESAIYTLLNNAAFKTHPYWADRDTEEDLELFYPFRFLLDNENLILAEVHGQPAGFFLWYPDFNQLPGSGKDLNLCHLLRFRLKNRINTFRFTEIGIIPEFQRTALAWALLAKSLPKLKKAGYDYCEGGFIFEENTASSSFVKRILTKVYGTEPEAYRSFAVFEADLT